jgi:hypothetical protein
MSDVYLGNPLLKKANTPIEFTQEQIEEFIKCQNDPVYFANNYIKIVSLDKGLTQFHPYEFQEKLINRFHEHRFNICKMPRQTGKCFNINTKIRIKNKKTGKILELSIGEFYEKLKKKSDTDVP